MSKLLGNNLIVRVGADETGDVLMCATSCTLNINQNATEASCKGDPDVGGNKWTTAIAGAANWDISTDGLYDDAMTNFSYDYLAGIIIGDANGTGTNELEIVFQINRSALIGDIEYYSGKVMITDISLNGPVDEFATYTASFRGLGPLVANAKIS